MAKLLRLDSWYFGLPSGLRVSSSLANTLFCFFLLPFFMVFCFCLPMCVSPTVSSAHSTRDDLSVIFCKDVTSSRSVTTLLSMGCHSGCPPRQVMEPRWTDHVPFSLESDFVHRKETTPLACRTDLLLSCTYRLVASGCGGYS
jgi:hypothetical protein